MTSLVPQGFATWATDARFKRHSISSVLSRTTFSISWFQPFYGVSWNFVDGKITLSTNIMVCNETNLRKPE